MYAYFDHNASTPMADAVIAAMLPWLGANYGNSASSHRYGRNAHAAVEHARQQLATAVNAEVNEVIFTSGGSEANNLALKSILSEESLHGNGQLLIGSIEHPSVLEPARQLSKILKWQYHAIAVDSFGYYDVTELVEYLQHFKQLQIKNFPTFTRANLISLMSVNNETGVIQPMENLAEQVLKQEIPYIFHCDAVQHFGKLALDFRRLRQCGVTSIAISAHKINGPQGVGALVFDRRLTIPPLIAGGGHEQGLRSGTLNVAGIVGFGAAAEIAAAEHKSKCAIITTLRLQLENGLLSLGAVIFSQQANRVENTTFFAFAKIDGETLVAKLDAQGFAVASGSACSSLHTEGQATISHVLRAMQVSPHLAKGALRVSLAATNTQQEIALFLQKLQSCIQELRQMKSLW